MDVVTTCLAEVSAINRSSCAHSVEFIVPSPTVMWRISCIKILHTAESPKWHSADVPAVIVTILLLIYEEIMREATCTNSEQDFSLIKWNMSYSQGSYWHQNTVFQDFPGLAETKFQGFPRLKNSFSKTFQDTLQIAETKWLPAYVNIVKAKEYLITVYSISKIRIDPRGDKMHTMYYNEFLL